MASPLPRYVRTPTPRRMGLGDALSWDELPALASGLAQRLSPLARHQPSRLDAQDTAANSLIDGLFDGLFDDSFAPAGATDAKVQHFAPSPSPLPNPKPAAKLQATASVAASAKGHVGAADKATVAATAKAHLNVNASLPGLVVYEIDEPEVFERFFNRARG